MNNLITKSGDSWKQNRKESFTDQRFLCTAPKFLHAAKVYRIVLKALQRKGANTIACSLDPSIGKLSTFFICLNIALLSCFFNFTEIEIVFLQSKTNIYFVQLHALDRKLIWMLHFCCYLQSTIEQLTMHVPSFNCADFLRKFQCIKIKIP